MIVTLESWEYEWASHVGMQRVSQHIGKNDDQNYYANNNKQPEILANIASCCGEMATAKALKKYWSGHVWDQRDHAKHDGTGALRSCRVAPRSHRPLRHSASRLKYSLDTA